MKIASLVLGIVSLTLAIIPFCSFIAIVPAIIGLVLGIVDTVKRSKKNKELVAKGEKKESQAMSVTALSLSGAAIFVATIWLIILMIIGYTNSSYTKYYSDDLFNNRGNSLHIDI